MTSEVASPLPETEETLREVIYTALGAASVAWTPDRVFDDQFATSVGEDLLMKIKVVVGFGEPSLGLATNQQLEEELAVRKDLGFTDPHYRTLERLEPSRALWHVVQEEWVGKEILWQHRDFPNIYSTDRGQTWYNVEEPVDIDGNPKIYSNKEN